MDFDVEAELVEWRGPAPFHFLRLPEDVSDAIHDAAHLLTYGWGAIPARAEAGGVRWTTALFPKDGVYLLPVKDAVRRPLGLELGAIVPVHVEVGRDIQQSATSKTRGQA